MTHLLNDLGMLRYFCIRPNVMERRRSVAAHWACRWIQPVIFNPAVEILVLNRPACYS